MSYCRVWMVFVLSLTQLGTVSWEQNLLLKQNNSPLSEPPDNSCTMLNILVLNQRHRALLLSCMWDFFFLASEGSPRILLLKALMSDNATAKTAARAFCSASLAGASRHLAWGVLIDQTHRTLWFHTFGNCLFSRSAKNSRAWHLWAPSTKLALKTLARKRPDDLMVLS